MKVKLKEIVLAVPALSKVADCNLSLRSAYALKKSIAELQKEADFFREQRDKYIAKYNVDTLGALSEDAARAMNDLLEMDVEPCAEKVVIPLSEGIRLSVNDLELLSPFITFTEETK